MTEFFAVIGENERQGPFDSISVPIALVKRISRERGYSNEQARDFFLNGSAVEEVETVNGKSDCFRVGWLAREEAGREVDSRDGIEARQSRHRLASEEAGKVRLEKARMDQGRIASDCRARAPKPPTDGG